MESGWSPDGVRMESAGLPSLAFSSGRVQEADRSGKGYAATRCQFAACQFLFTDFGAVQARSFPFHGGSVKATCVRATPLRWLCLHFLPFGVSSDFELS